jgi:hypothetical protein
MQGEGFSGFADPSSGPSGHLLPEGEGLPRRHLLQAGVPVEYPSDIL